MSKIMDAWVQGGQVRRQRELDQQKLQRQQRLDDESRAEAQQKRQIDQQLFEQRKTKATAKKYFNDIPLLNQYAGNGDVEGMRRVIKRIGRLSPEYGEGAEMMNQWIDNGELDKVKSHASGLHNQAIEIGAIIQKRGSGAFEQRTANAKDWEQFQGLLKRAKETGDPNDAISAEQFGRRSNFIKPTEQEVADIKVTAAEQKEIRKANARRKQGFIDNGVAAADSMANIRRSIDLLKTVETGGIDNALLRAKQFFGIEGSNEAELSANLGKNVLAQLKPIFGSAFTDAEGKRLERLEAKFGSSTAANKRLLNQVFKITERAARRGLAAAEDQKATFTADEIRAAMAFKLDDKDFSSPVQQEQINAGQQKSITVDY